MDFLPRRGSSGLPVPCFGPEAAWALLLPAEEPPAPELPDGRRKLPKAFRVPGGRAQATVTTRIVSDGTVLRDGNTRALIVQSTGNTVANRNPAKGTEDGAAEIAGALLEAGVLKESDWCGGLERTVRRGLARWVNEDMGAAAYRFFGPLELIYTDDAPAYNTGARMGRWSEHFRARGDRPVGFFGLRWQEGARAVHIRSAIQSLEQAWPGYGAGLIELIQSATVSGICGHTFLWGREFIKMGEAQHEAMLKRFERHDQDPLGMFDGEMQPLPDDLTLKAFHEQVPEAVCKGGWRLPQARLIAHRAPKEQPHLAPITAAALALWDACRACGLTFYTTNHMPFLNWQMRTARMDMRTGEMNRGPVEYSVREIPKLYRAPCFYTVWEDAGRACEELPPDLMGQLVDDHTHACKESWSYSDLTWLHAFQIGHSCPDPGGAAKDLAARERAVRKAAKSYPELLAWHDPDYVPGPMPDGGLAHAVQALRLALGIVRALDDLLTLLHRPATLMERSRMGLP